MEHYLQRGQQMPAITCIGGGTGLSTMLRGLKHYSEDITAIVTVTDDGGGSGVLRDELCMPPPGDIRNCILALSNIEPTMQQLMSYRFTSGSLEGQSFGNLLLAAMNGISKSFDEAVARMGEVLAITGRVLPVTNEDVRLMAEFEDGSIVYGESKIIDAKKVSNCRIKRVQIVPSPATALAESVRALEESDLILLGPGSLYTSIIPNLLVDGIHNAIEHSKAQKIYICNIMTQPGETDGYTASDHVKELFRYSSSKLFDICLLNSSKAMPALVKKYSEEGASQIVNDAAAIESLGVEVIKAPLAGKQSDLARHNPAQLAAKIMDIYNSKANIRQPDNFGIMRF